MRCFARMLSCWLARGFRLESELLADCFDLEELCL